MRLNAPLYLLMLLLPATVLAAEVEMNLKEGAWSITVQTPQIETATETAVTSTPDQTLPTVQPFCITRKDPVPQPTRNNQCRLINKDIQGDTVFWVMECKDEQTTTRTVGNATYSGKKVEGSMQVTTRSPGAPALVTTMPLSGRYVGACR